MSRRGARVAFVARSEASVERVAKETGACGIVGDASRKEAIHPIALEIVWNFGGLDALINNASSLGPTPLALLADTECEQLEEALSVNLVDPFRLTSLRCRALSPMTICKPCLMEVEKELGSSADGLTQDGVFLSSFRLYPRGTMPT
jgi:NAD(P)-dependent dehydrogenase (short-subunit alcohol dehydrogenase family)